MEDLEEQCEDALFQTCDARERYPQLCAEELEKCIKLTNDIHTAKVMVKPEGFPDMLPLIEKQSALLNNALKKRSVSYGHQDKELKKMLDKIENLNLVIEQIEREKFSEINKLFQE